MCAGWSPGHYLRPNHASWAPSAVIRLDTETKTVGEGPAEVEVLRCWHAELLYRHSERHAGELLTASGTTRAEAAQVVDEWAREAGRAWLYAHNIGFDLVTTGLPAGLARHGWELSSRFALSGGSPWLVMHTGRYERTRTAGKPGRPDRHGAVEWRHTLTLADSFSLLPVRLADIAPFTGTDKPPLPGAGEGLDAWLARCMADVRILGRALDDLMAWWEASQLGRWSVSGAGCGWASYRHSMPARSVVIEADEAALHLERGAVYGGRRTAYRVGQLPPGRYAEADFEAAYPTIAANELLPSRRAGVVTPAVARAILDGRARYGIVAEAEIETDRARWPVRHKGRVLYPVGRFRTILAGPDLAWADQAGALRSVGRGYFYDLSDHMAGWARWVLSLRDAPDDEVPPVAKIWGKGASRSVCGKWAQRGMSVTPFVGPPGDDWVYEDCFIAGSEHRASIVGLAGTYYLSVADQPGEHEFPAVLAYIEAHTRVRLGQVVEAAPEGSVIQDDTDGMMIACQAIDDRYSDTDRAALALAGYASPVAAELAVWSKLADPLVMREKTSFTRAQVLGPQHVVLDGRPRFAGVPGGAWQTGEGQWSARLWPSMSWQITQGSAEGYVRPVQPYLVVGPYAAGWVLDNGAVRPPELALDEGGHNHALPWPQTRWAQAGDQLGPRQADWAKGLWDGPEDHEPAGTQDPDGQPEARGGPRGVGRPPQGMLRLLSGAYRLHSLLQRGVGHRRGTHPGQAGRLRPGTSGRARPAGAVLGRWKCGRTSVIGRLGHGQGVVVGRLGRGYRMLVVGQRRGC